MRAPESVWTPVQRRMHKCVTFCLPPFFDFSHSLSSAGAGSAENDACSVLNTQPVQSTMIERIGSFRG